VFDEGGRVAGTIDIESEKPDAFDADTQAMLEACAAAIRPLW
jgi:putative methionine-R-sulfoxide reductase with GAF domain